MRLLLASISAAGLVSTASAQTCVHYWNFTSMNDLVGNVPTTAVGSPDLSQNATYGEAFPGAGASLNNVAGGTGAGGGHLEAAVVTGPMAAMDFGTDSFSFSYWGYDDLAGDGDARGVRVFDNLDGTTTGIQLGTNLTNDWNFRVDDDAGNAHIYNVSHAFQAPSDQWYHIVGVVDRTADEVRAYLNGALVMAVPFVDTQNGNAMSGNVFATIDLQIGAINGGTNVGQAQSQGLDDLAFYDGVLSAADAMALANGTVSPPDFGSPITRYCSPAVPNSTGAPGVIDASGSIVVTDNNLTLTASSLPPNAFGFYLTGRVQGMVMNPGGSQGVLCLTGAIGRYVGPGQVLNSGASGSFSLLLDLTQVPTPTGLVPVVAGETWNFTTWHRDQVGGMSTSNFTDALSITFQ